MIQERGMGTVNVHQVMLQIHGRPQASSTVSHRLLQGLLALSTSIFIAFHLKIELGQRMFRKRHIINSNRKVGPVLVVYNPDATEHGEINGLHQGTENNCK